MTCDDLITSFGQTVTYLLILDFNTLIFFILDYFPMAKNYIYNRY